MHSHSLLAHAESTEDGGFNKREQEIILALRAKGPMTDRQTMYELCYEERNCVAPRITELIKRGIVEECGSTKDSVTCKTVRIVRLASKEAQTSFL